VPLYSHSPGLFVQGVAGMCWDAFKHSPFPLTSAAIWVNSYPGNLFTLCCHFIEKVNVLLNHRLVDLFRRQFGQSFPARALVNRFNWFLLFDEVVPLVDWGTIRGRVLIWS
jgi:hypothetical protein